MRRLPLGIQKPMGVVQVSLFCILSSQSSRIVLRQRAVDAQSQVIELHEVVGAAYCRTVRSRFNDFGRRSERTQDIGHEAACKV